MSREWITVLSLKEKKQVRRISKEIPETAFNSENFYLILDVYLRILSEHGIIRPLLEIIFGYLDYESAAYEIGQLCRSKNPSSTFYGFIEDEKLALYHRDIDKWMIENEIEKYYIDKLHARCFICSKTYNTGLDVNQNMNPMGLLHPPLYFPNFYYVDRGMICIDCKSNYEFTKKYFSLNTNLT